MYSLDHQRTDAQAADPHADKLHIYYLHFSNVVESMNWNLELGF
jgi:hypothetical protein